MSSRDGVKITETSVSIFGEGHAPFLNMEPLRRADGDYPGAIIVATQDPGGLIPRALMLPHQLYTDTAARILADSGQRNLWVLPVYDSTDWTQVEIPATDDEIGGRAMTKYERCHIADGCGGDEACVALCPADDENQ